MLSSELVIYSCLAAILAAVLLSGWTGYQNVMKKNPCKMTYSYPRKTLVESHSRFGNFSLFKISNPDSTRLNKFPVLFIPGHLGSADQVRSFASHMHNEDNHLQYFAVDFRHDLVGIHGGDILTKAAFVCDALDAILTMYGTENQDDVKITLLGHSYGGYIAKTSLLLCRDLIVDKVELLVMLGSPNLQAPFSPDATLATLFHDVNKAWYNSFYRDRVMSLCPPSLQPSTQLQFRQCREALQRVSVISITGGSIDVQVPPDSTNLFSIAAHPRNGTLLRKSTAKTVSFSLNLYLSIKENMMNTVRSVLQYVPFLGKKVDQPQNETLGADGLQHSTVNATSFDESEVESQGTLDPSSPYYHLSKRSWETDMSRYVEPHHISVRSVLLSDVGFPIDHNALLWCYEFVSSVSTAMRVVLERELRPNDDFDLHEVLKLNDVAQIEETVDEPRVLGIAQLLNYIRRNETNNLFKSGSALEDKIVGGYLGTDVKGRLLHFALKLSTFVWLRLPFGVFVASMLAALSALLNVVVQCDNNRGTSTQVLVRRWNGLLTSLCAVVSLAKDLAGGSMFNLSTCLAVVVAVIVYRLKITLSLFGDILSMLMVILVGEFVAILFQFMLVSTRTVGYAVFTIVSFINRKLPSRVGQFVQNWAAAEMFSLPILILTSRSIALNSITLSSLLSLAGVTNVVLLWLHMTNIIRAVWFVFESVTVDTTDQRSASTMIQCVHSLRWLFIAVVLLLSPSFKFSAELVLSPAVRRLNALGLFTLFGVDRIHAVLSFTAACLFGRAITTDSLSSWTVEKISLQQLGLGISPSSTSKPSGTCVHEDGGRFAVFRKVAAAGNDSKTEAFTLDTTYAVERCFCFKDPTLKSVDEWCEWCQCPKCGGGHRRGNADDTKHAVSLHLDLVLTLLFGAVILWTVCFGRNELYIFAYCIAGVGLACWIRTLFQSSWYVAQI